MRLYRERATEANTLQRSNTNPEGVTDYRPSNCVTSFDYLHMSRDEVIVRTSDNLFTGSKVCGCGLHA